MDSINVKALSEGLLRTSVFTFYTVDDTLRFYHYVLILQSLFNASAEKTSRYTRLVEVTLYIINKTVHVKFRYTYNDIAGQNITTIATHRAYQDLLTSIINKDFRIIDF